MTCFVYASKKSSGETMQKPRFANAISSKILCTGQYNVGEARDINFGPQREKLVFGVFDKV